MTLGNKIVALFLVLGICFSLGSFFVFKAAVFPTFQEFENESMEATLSRIDQVLEADLFALRILNNEYSRWDHTYEYVQGERPEFAAENLNPANWQSIDMHMMLIFDVHGQFLYGRIQDPVDGHTLPFEQEFLQSFTPDNPLVKHDSSAHFVSGLLRTRSGIMQVVSDPILTSNGQGPVAGSFVTGQFISEQRVAEIGRRVTTNLSMHYNDLATTPPMAAALLNGTLSPAGSAVHSHDETFSQSYRLVKDIFGAPIAVFEAQLPRRMTRIGNDTVRTVTLMMAAFTAIFMLAAVLFMRRLIIAPLNTLTGQILDIRNTGNLHFKSDINRSDEVGVLSGEFQAMTEQLGQVQRKLEGARDNALAMAKSKSEFLARMSHEIRTPMNGVLGMTELLRDTPLNSKQSRFTDTIYTSAESLLSIINDVLDFSKIEAGKLHLNLTDVNLCAVVEETVVGMAGQAHAKGLELMTMIPPGLIALVLADPDRLRQVLTNLVANAIKFTEQGEVVVKLSVSEANDERLNVLFEIRDTGIGIEFDKQDEIFESFTQADGSTTRLYGGTGLGLTICKQLVNQMGGNLNVTSTPGIGSTFSFTLGLKISNTSASVTNKKTQCVAGRHILIVDDNATNREILEHQLGSWSATTESASSAKQACQIITRATDNGKPFDLALLDMHMPEADGLDLAQSIRSNPGLSELKLMLLSSVASPASEDMLQKLGIAGQLTKPVRQAQLYDALACVLGDARTFARNPNVNSSSTRQLSGRILLAEDNPVNQVVALCMLENFGLNVEIAANGCEAIEKFSSGLFDAVLMDCQMPIMDGFKATQMIRAAEAESGCEPIPIIAVTANALKGDREKCLATGMNEYLTKPFTGEQLHALLALYLPLPIEENPAPAALVTQEAQSKVVALREFGPAIDRVTLNKLTSLQQPGAPNIVVKLLNLYLESSLVIKTKLVNAIEEKNSEDIRESAHALKSSSANVGAVELAHLCRKLENMGRENVIFDAATIKLQLENEYARVVAALENELLEVCA